MMFGLTIIAFSIYVCSFAFVILLTRWLYRLYLHPLASFSGPKWAAMTTLYAMSYDLPTKSSYIKVFPALHDKYGPIIRIEPNHLHIRDIDAYNEVFRMGTPYNKDPAIYDFPFSKGALVGQAKSKYARGHRSMYATFFSRSVIISLETVVKENLNRFLARLNTFGDDNQSVNLNWGFRCLTQDVIAQYVFNKKLDSLSTPGFADQMIISTEEFMASPMLTAGWYFPKTLGTIATWLKHWPTIGRKISKPCAIALDQLKFCAEGIQSLKDIEKGGGRCVFDTALNPDTQKGHPVLDDEVLGADGWMLMVAGTDTSATTLTFGVWYMLNNPEYLRKLREELDNAIPFSHDLAVFEKGWVELEKLEYLQCIVKESLRLSYGQPGKAPRVIPPEGAVLCNQFVPGGTVVSMSCYSYHHNPAYFRSHPHDEFRPERWLNREDAEWNDKFFIPFSRGSRDCLGRNLALATLYVTFAYLFRRFDLQLVETTKDDMEWHDGLIPVTNGHLKVKVAKRID